MEKTFLRSLCFSEEFFFKSEFPSLLKILCPKQNKKNPSSVPDKCHFSSHNFPAAGKICSRRWKKQGCDYPVFHKCTLRTQVATRSHFQGVLEAHLNQKIEEQFIRVFGFGFLVRFLSKLTMLTSEIWSMLEIWMLIPTVTGLPETQMDWVRTIFKSSSLVCY